MEKLQIEEFSEAWEWYERDYQHQQLTQILHRGEKAESTHCVKASQPNNVKPSETENQTWISASQPKRSQKSWKPKVSPIEGIIVEKPKRPNKQFSKELRQFAQTLIDELKSYGFHVLRYDAQRSNSIYLKLDYGVACSVRISDHIGYDHLHYRFNAILGLKISKTITHQGKERHFLTLEDYRRLVTLIISERNLKRQRFSEKNYLYYQERNKARVGKEPRGFYRHCYEA